MNMIYTTHIPKTKRQHALRDVYAIELAAPKANSWSALPITFDHKDHPASICHGGSVALVHDPIIDGYHFTRVLMDRGSSLNLIYEHTIQKMGIDLLRIKPSSTTFKGVIPDMEACCSGTLTLELVSGSPDNFSSEDLMFDITPFCSSYHALLGWTMFTRFNAVPHYAYLKLKMTNPRGVIIVNGNMKRSLCIEEHTTASAAEYKGPKCQPTIQEREAKKWAPALP